MKTILATIGIFLAQNAVFGQGVRPLPVPVPWDRAFDGTGPAPLNLPPAEEVPPVGDSSRAGDALSDLPACNILDAAFFRAPSRAEAMTMLSACLRAFSDRYGADVSAGPGRVRGPQGEAEGIILTVAGERSAADELRTALNSRGGSLLGIPALVRESETLALEGSLSSLQPVIDHCPGVSSVRSPAEFVSAYADCLRRSKGLSISRVLVHPTRSSTLLVYTEGPDGLRDMNGVVRLGTGSARLTLRVEAHRQPASGAGAS